MSKLTTLKRHGDPDAARFFREIADKIESGQVGDFFLLADDRDAEEYTTCARFHDRWRMTGAIEWAKTRLAE